MGAISKAFAPQSSYAAKKTSLWEDVTDRIEGCLYLAMLDEAEVWIASIVLRIPHAWHEPIAELIEKKREELQSENITEILKDKYDF